MSTYLGLHYHIIFGTKHREPSITPDIRHRLHEYLGGLVHGLGAETHGIGGVADHVHLLVTLKATHCLADFMRELKKASSIWMKTEGAKPKFEWQEGYCAITVSPSARGAVSKYIAGQEEHHRVRTFSEELVDLLKKAGLPYDERHLP
ncbi:IS200/IS605 family transposase [Haloferula sp. BvORR071]|uniref:IS200/IS605 family transposase n=1 Tax=Haloferula sp. BvORR071 TaxID=1396141 RepID=UPI000558CBFE|nr:IS200/IS605 family transposase [Haloferula sp. BvORR071]